MNLRAYLRISLLAVLAATLVACGSTSAPAPKASAVVGTVPFADGERMTYVIREDWGSTTARGVLTVRRDGDRLRLEQRYEEAQPPAGAQPNVDASSVVVGAADLRPVAMERTITGRDASHAYRATYAVDAKSVEVTAEGGKPKSLPLGDVYYDNESALWIWRTLPLAEGYRARYVSIDAIARTRQTVDIEVTGTQTVEVPAGTFQAWRLQVRSGRATRVAWINVDAPHEIGQWDNGAQVFRLEARR
jgi:hypothetical protein